MGTPKFDFPYKRIYTFTTEHKTIIFTYGSGKEQRHPQGTHRRGWRLVFEKEYTDADSIQDFFDARQGRFEHFYFDWSKPDGTVETDIKVRFAIDKLSIKNQYDILFTFGLPLIEVY